MTHALSTELPNRRRPGDRYRFMALAVAALIACMTVFGGMFSASAPAEAAAAPGAGGYWTPSGGWLGNYIAGGQRVYCIDVLTDTAGSGGVGHTSDRIQEAGHGTRPVSGSELQMVNYAVSVWGQTSDPVTAAAVGAYVYNFTSANWHGRGEHYIRGPHASAILAKYQQIMADTAANFDRAEGAGAGVIQLDIDPTNHYLGTLQVSGLSPSNAVGSISLENGVFADTGLPTRDGVTNNSSFAVTGVPPESGGAYRIRAEGAFRGSGEPVYEPSVTVYAEGSMQRTVGPGNSRPSVVNFVLSGEDSSDRTTVFHPIVGTQVASKFVALGEEFADVLTFSVAPDSHGLTNPWYRNQQGEFAPIRALGTLYGPFLSQPEVSDSVPPQAPVAASGIEIVTTPESGPTATYTAPSGTRADEAGYYTWVWEITAAEQEGQVRGLLPEDYVFVDRFGQVMETSITPSHLAISTQVTRSIAGAGQTVIDEVSVQALDGGWLQAGGARVPATLTGAIYFTESEPVLSDTPPDDAELLGTTRLVVNKPGSVHSDIMRLPLKEGYVTFQWCIREEEQPEEYRGLIRSTCDKYGQASETVKVVLPTVTTEAKPVATPHDALHDTAIVTGELAENVFLEFSLFKQPAIGDPRSSESDGDEHETWGREAIDGLNGQPWCASDNLIETTARVAVDPGSQDGARYTSPEIVPAKPGTYWWVETLVHVDPFTQEETILHRGECGLPNETSRVMEPQVVTNAVHQVRPGGEAYDTATLTGPIPEVASGLRAELTFEIFQSTDEAKECTEHNLFASLDSPVAVSGEGEYRSEAVVLDEPGTYFWVETLAYVDSAGEREIVHVGACGIPDETTRVSDELAVTGLTADTRPNTPQLVFAAFLLGLGLLGVGIGLRQRQRR